MGDQSLRRDSTGLQKSAGTGHPGAAVRHASIAWPKKKKRAPASNGKVGVIEGKASASKNQTSTLPRRELDGEVKHAHGGLFAHHE